MAVTRNSRYAEITSNTASAALLVPVFAAIAELMGLPPKILGSELVTDIALNGLEGLVGASFVVESDPVKAADLLNQRITSKRLALGLKA